VHTDPHLGRKLHPGLPYIQAEVIWAAQQEMALTIEDVLARRMRALFLNARAALEMAPMVAELMARVLGWSADFRQRQLRTFDDTAKNYVL